MTDTLKEILQSKSFASTFQRGVGINTQGRDEATTRSRNGKAGVDGGNVSESTKLEEGMKSEKESAEGLEDEGEVWIYQLLKEGWERGGKMVGKDVKLTGVIFSKIIDIVTIPTSRFLI